MDHYSQLLAFIWATEQGSFSAAARAHDLSPSAISKLISRLEDRLQVRLFQRGARSLSLTEEGAAYLRSARAVVEAMAEADSLAEALPARVGGTLRIHTMATFAKHQILPWLDDFLDRYPGLDVELQLGAQYLDQFDQGLDLAIHSGVLPNSSRIARRIGESEWLLCASPDYLARRGTPGHPQELLEHRCFNFGFDSPWNTWAFRVEGEMLSVPVVARASFTQGDLLRDMALSGAGIVKLADFHIGADIRAGRLVPLLRGFGSGATEPIYLVYANRKHLSPRIKVFRDFLEARMRRSPWGLPAEMT
ncbi:LysR family transcriptional regulator [Pseudomonas sp. RIT-PI-AD]|uniref:LysR family transcriptional regulator n=1 Tax=Pseudomonas sp. RIT-PI-AD TaxID=3035294 RepID=UPI0021D83CAE|nr:LysR family transcriptional regulator [Pseudomonas sp. RIT-PI-AD]